MKRLRINHTTGFHYEGEVNASYNEARMLPAGSENQFVLSSFLNISPMSSLNTYVDYWGTRVSAFEVLTPHRDLTLTATSLIEVRENSHVPHPFGWDELALASLATIDTVDHVAQTSRTEPPIDVAALAADIAQSGLAPCESALQICQSIGESVEYMAGVTGVHSTAAEAWVEKKGVCQDIAHIALGALRSVGIPARYVSGYLHPKPDAAIGETVTGESHAWVEWYCGGWRGFDPTNLIDIGDRHVLVGRGRDYTDVAPLRGVYAGPFGSELFVNVEITREF